jgi:hypothetical protein
MDKTIFCFLRPDDNEIFSINEDQITFSNHVMKVMYPLSIHHKFSKEYLLDLKFIPLVKFVLEVK